LIGIAIATLHVLIAKWTGVYYRVQAPSSRWKLQLTIYAAASLIMFLAAVVIATRHRLT
jgi:hypothetical protein